MGRYAADMTRPLRIEQAGGWHHITARGNERKAIYREERVNPAWVSLGSPILGTGAVISVPENLPLAGSTQRFYRLVEGPP